MQSNYQDSDEDSFDEDKVNNIYDKKCLKIKKEKNYIKNYMIYQY